MSTGIIADLHTHSTRSDGDCAPAEVVREARAAGLEAVALTDHDTITGLDEALREGKKIGMTVICGVEVSLRFRRPDFTGSLHYLLYFPGRLVEQPDFVASLTGALAEGRGHELVKDRVSAINELFGPNGTVEQVLKQPLSPEEVESGALNVTRRHFAQALERHHALGSEAINRLISNDSPAYVPSGIPLERLKPIFARFPTLRVLAHPAAGSFSGPGVYREVLPPWETVERMLPEFLELGLDGLEVMYPGHTPAHMKLLRDIAKKHALLMTGGSDFHDRVKRPIGTAGMNMHQLQLVMDRLC